jgi:hypothetical protein
MVAVARRTKSVVVPMKPRLHLPSPPSASSAVVSRRSMLLTLIAGVAATSALGCSEDRPSRSLALPREIPGDGAPEATAFSDALDAVADVLVPAARSVEDGRLVPGAREARVDRVLDIGRFAPLAVALGFIPTLPEVATAAITASGDAFRAALGAELDALAALEQPLTPFKDLPRARQEVIVMRAFDDDRLALSLLLVRAACMAAYAGGIASDVGMQEMGFPPFEDLADGLAVSGYPRTRSDGRLLDPARDNLAAIAAKGDLDDYTYNEAPAVTPGDDLSLHLDAFGDLP